MFIQSFQGRTDNAEALRSQFEAWRRDHASKAEGWLGSTAGVTDEGEFIGVVRFESEEAARRNSDRPEQGRWWEETASHFSGPVEFHDYPNADLLMGGGSDDTGFVQVIQGRTSDLERLRELQEGDQVEEYRTDIMGGSYGWDEQGNVIEVVYFTTEAEAREGERRMSEAPEDVRADYEAYRELITDLRYFDLRTPWVWSPG